MLSGLFTTVAAACALEMPGAAPSIPRSEALQSDLSVRLEEGDTFRLHLARSTTGDAEVMQMEINTKLTYETDLDFTVLNVGEEAYSLRVRHGHAQGAFKSPFGQLEFDSTEPPEGDLGMAGIMVEPLLLMVDKTYTFELTRDGQVRNVTGFREIMEGSEIGKKMMKSGVEHRDDLQAEFMQLLFAKLPTERPKKGLRWESRYTVGFMEKPVEFRPVFELDDLSKAEATWSFDTRAKVEAAEAGAEVEVDYDPNEEIARWMSETSDVKDAAFSGAVRVSRKDGLPIEQSSSTTLVMDMIEPNSGASMALETTDTLEVTRVEKE